MTILYQYPFEFYSQFEPRIMDHMIGLILKSRIEVE